MTETRDKAVSFAHEYLKELSVVLRGVPLNELAQAIEVLERAHTERRQVFLAGNGGSAATASHMANDLVWGVAKGGGHGFRAIALSDNIPLMTAIANDESYEEVFAVQLAALGQEGDVLIVFSGSGNSPNILRILEVADTMQITTVAFLGMGGGRAAKLASISVIVPADDYGPVEDVHMVFDHLITTYLRGWASRTPQEAPR